MLAAAAALVVFESLKVRDPPNLAFVFTVSGGAAAGGNGCFLQQPQ